MRVLISGGGTGGHVNPAIAIANTLRDNIKGIEIAFVGTARGIENKLVPAEGYHLYHIEIQGIRRSLSLQNIKTAYLVLTSGFRAGKIINEFQPDLVVGTGGYVCWPVVREAARRGIPTALHESNAVPGVAVKVLEKHVDKIFINFEETKDYLRRPDKAVRTGNPLKNIYWELSYDGAREQLGIKGKFRRFLLSCGGSMGAERINEEMLEIMKNYTSKHPEIKHLHGTGAIEYASAKARFEEYGLDHYPNLELVEFIYDMPLKMAAADLVINRAGAITLSELAALGKPCVLIPSPNVTNNHQCKNARALEKQGAASVFEEKELNAGRLESEISALLSDRKRLAEMSEKIRMFAIKNSNKIIFSELKKLVNC